MYEKTKKRKNKNRLPFYLFSFFVRTNTKNGKTTNECVYLSANRFSMAWENGIQMPFTFFVFAWHWKTDFVFRFRFTLKNGYEFQFSFFVFASLWKTDLNFVFRFCITCYWKTDRSFVCYFCMNLKSGLMHQSFETPPPLPKGMTGIMRGLSLHNHSIFIPR